MSTIKTSSDLFAAAALRTEVVEVEGVGVQIRELSLAARDEFRDRLAESGNTAAVISLLKHGVLNGDGAPLLTDEDAAKLSDTSPRIAEALTREILSLSGLGEDVDDADPTES